MNFFEWDKEKWAKISCGLIWIVILCTWVALWIALAYFDYENSSLTSIYATIAIVVCVTALYLFLRLLRYLYLNVTNQLWKSKNQSWALSAVKRMNNQNKLKRVVKEISVSFCSVRKAAVERITDQEFLKEVAIKAFDVGVRLEAADKLYILSGNADSLKLIIRELSDNLRSGNNAERMHRIYKRYPNDSVGELIRKNNGRLVDEGWPHTDEHTDEETSHNGWFCDHLDSHTDIPSKPSKYFFV